MSAQLAKLELVLDRKNLPRKSFLNFSGLEEQVTFRSGSCVSGVLRLHLQSPLQCCFMRVLLLQEANGSWNHDGSDTDLDSRVYAKLSHTETVCEWSSARNTELEIGSHEYQFELTLPPSCPSSLNYWDLSETTIDQLSKDLPGFDDYSSEVRYVLKGELHATSSGVHSIAVPLNIKGYLNINEPILQQPRQANGSKRVSFWRFDLGTVEFTTEVPCTGFDISDSIPVRVDVNNNSSRLVFIKATIVQRREYRAYYYHENTTIQKFNLRDGQLLLKEFRKQVVSSRYFPVGSQTHSVVNISLKINSGNFLPTTTSECFALSYYLQVSAHCPLSNAIAQSPAELEIVIGK